MKIYYRVITEWCKWPFNNEVDKRYCVFSYSKKRFSPIDGIEMDSDTSIKEKEEYLKQKLNLKKVTVEKIK